MRFGYCDCKGEDGRTFERLRSAEGPLLIKPHCLFPPLPRWTPGYGRRRQEIHSSGAISPPPDCNTGDLQSTIARELHYGDRKGIDAKQ